MNNTCNQKYCLLSLAIALGITWGASILLLAWINIAYQYGTPIIYLLSSVYIGYTATITGGLWGFLWGFLDMFIGVLIVGGIYHLVRCIGCKICSCFCKK